MKYLIDSDYVADYLVAKPQATELLTKLSQDSIAISLITYGEIYEGIYYGHDPQKTEEVFHHFLRLADTLPLTQTIMQQFARIRGELRRTGQIIGDFDILIAATAIQHHLILVTRNLRDYTRIPQLQIYTAK
jgi:predicted nucleic acid-binding protein